MPVTFAINNVLDRVRAEIVVTLTAVGEVPQSIPGAETADQVAFFATDLPATILQTKSCEISQDGCNVGELRLRLPVLIHHVRGLDASGNASDTATARLAAIAEALYADYKLLAVSEEGDPPIEQVQIVGLDRGEDNPVQAMLDAEEQNGSLVAVVLTLMIEWVESHYS